MLRVLIFLSIILVIISSFAKGDETKYYFNRSVYSSEYEKLPKVLSEQDMELYYKIYKAQNKGKFEDADGYIAMLSDDILLGYMYFFRFMSPLYKSSFSELSQWLDKYSNIAVANQIYQLAQKKAPSNASKLKLKSPNSFYDRFIPLYLRDDSFNNTNTTSFQVSKNNKVASKKEKNSITKRLDKYINSGKTLNIKNILLEKKTKTSLNNYTYNYYVDVLVKLYFFDGMDDLVIYWGQKLLKESKTSFADTLFYMGMSHFRKKEYVKAQYYFKALATGEGDVDLDNLSKGAYWLSRVDLLLGEVNAYFDALNITSNYKYNFYGILASEELGIINSYANQTIDYQENKVELLLKSEYGRRALALLQFGLLDWAEQELIFLGSHGVKNISLADEKEVLKVIAYLAQNIPMPALSLKLAGQNGKYYGLFDLTYPIFLLNLEDGYRVDPALLLAVIKKESLFFTAAQSAPGAMGLMQVLPSTAQYLIDKYNLKASKNLSYSLTSPSYNIEIGQNYINLLLNNPDSEKNLIYVLGGYNAGFSVMKKWKNDKHRKPEDALFFIESISYKETRNYIKSVLTDYWIYQLKLGITPHSLISIVQGGQPVYQDLSTDEIYRFNSE